MAAHIGKRLLKLLLLFSLCCACFSYGMAAGRYRIFPYQVVRDARTALVALAGTSQNDEPGGLATYKDEVRVPTVRVHSPNAGSELILVSGGAGYLKTHCPTGCLAWLMDRTGQIRHTWKYDPALWSDLKLVSQVPMVSGQPYPVGIHLYDDGGLLVTYHAQNTFPYAVGLARLDVNSKLIWKKELLTHHWLSVADDGRIFVPALRPIDSPIPIGRTRASIVSDTGKAYNDVILVLDADGSVLDEIPMLSALFDSGWAGLLTRPNSATESADCLTDDPLHLNDVRIANRQVAQWQPWLSPGDLLVSLRNINAVGIVDIATRRFKWMSSGSTVAQHSPRFYDGGVLVLDNLGGDKQLGGTRLVKIDLETGQPSTVFPRPGIALPDLCCTLNCGHLDISRDGRRVLMAITRSGAVWEIDLQTGEVLWEYLYVHPNEQGIREGINTAKYVTAPSFLTDLEQP